jgi:hypothetical protein
MSRYLAGRVGLHESQIRFVLLELREGGALLQSHRPVGAARRHRHLYPRHGFGGRRDRQPPWRPLLGGHAQPPGAFEGAITNRQNIGKTADELVQLWNEEHPDDQVAD